MRYTKLHHNQSGLVSIIVTMLVMAILGITVIGFAQISRREQRQTLDRQLSTAAYYAAESGINDAIKKLEDVSFIDNIDTCNDSRLPSQSIGTSGSFAYSCLMIDQNPDKLEYGSIDTDKSQIIPIDSGISTIQRIEVSWQDKAGSTTPFFPTHSTPISFPAGGSWGFPAGMLEVNLTPETSTLSRDTMISNTITGYLYPSQGTSGNLLSTSKGDIVSGGCSSGGTPRHCKINITGLSGTKYLMRLRAIYKSSAVTIRAFGGSDQLELKGAQAVIDSTGKANDVLRRVQVRVPRYTNYNYPEYVLDSADSICKQLSIYPSGGNDYCTSP